MTGIIYKSSASLRWQRSERFSTFFCRLAHQLNPRFGGGFPFSFEAGVDFPEIRYQLSIGEYAIIGAGAVVTRSIPAKCTAVGVPAKVVKTKDGE